MKSTKRIILRLKIEKFIKEQLWQHALVLSIIALFAWLFDKEIEAVCFCLAHFVLRPKMEKQYHKDTTRGCLMLTAAIIFFGILFSIPIGSTLLVSVPLAFFVSWVGYIVQDRIDLQLENKRLRDKANKPFNPETATEAELVERCRRCGLSAENTALAVEFFIKKTPHKILADRYSWQIGTAAIKKQRMKKLLTAELYNDII